MLRDILIFHSESIQFQSITKSLVVIGTFENIECGVMITMA